jgi:phosphoadenosine phosphosulfate reductase
MSAFADAAVAELCEKFEQASPVEIITWARDEFGDALCLTTSLTDALMVDLVAMVDPTIDIVFLDTQYHFAETLEMLITVRERYGIDVRVLSPSFEPDDLWQLDTDTCCKRRKVDQLDAALVGRRAWMSGLRRADDPTRACTPIIERDRRGLVKINPIATWSDEQVARHLRTHDVPINPLQARGYPSIGCWPCTRPVNADDGVRAGRWAGTTKTECGLHL